MILENLILEIGNARDYLLFLVVFLTANFAYRWMKWRKNLPPGPVGVPVLGYLPFLGQEPHKDFLKLKQRYGDIFGLYMGRSYTIIVNEFHLAKELLNNSAALDREKNVLLPLEPLGFGTASGPEWIEQRRFSFHAARELGFGKGPWETIIVEEALYFAKYLGDLNGAPADISQDVRESVSSNIVYFLTGKKLDKVADKETISLTLKYAEVALAAFGPALPTSVMPWIYKYLVKFRISGYDKVSKIINNALRFMRQEVDRHKQPELKEVKDLINSYLLKLEKVASIKEPNHHFTEENLVGMINSLFLGGSDTIVSSINWVLRLMAVHPDIQSKAYAEIMEVLGKEGIARFEERYTLPYTFAVLMESQRYSSIVPLSNARRANQDIEFKGFRIPKGTQIIPNLWALNHDPNYWEEPHQFRPERFLDKNGKTHLKALPSFAPFSLGRRNCPGENIAWMEILSYFTEIMKRFHISMAPGVKGDLSELPGLVTHLKPQLMCFTKRKE